MQKKIKTGRYASLVSKMLIMAFAISFFACSKEDDPVAEIYDIEIMLQAPDGYDESLEGVEIKVNSTSSSNEQTKLTDTSGKVTFNLEAGMYNFTASKATGEFALNGSLEATVSETSSLTLKLNASAIGGGLVFKEIYYSGSKTKEGKNYYSDQFVELYNNSDEVIYLDGLCIGTIDPANSGNKPSKWADSDGNLPSRLPFTFYVCAFPGSGKEHPLEPRTSIVIAQDAIDHQTDPAGNPMSPVNLGNADWELYVGDINNGKDANNPAVPNLEVIYAHNTTMHDVLYSVFGPAMFIFRFPEGVKPKDFASDEKNLALRPNTKKNTYLMVPKEYVIDAVECVRPEENKRIKRVPDDLDAGYVFCEGSYNSKSVRRKVKQIIDGKVIYQDTNNSTNDFLGDQTPTPKVHPTKVD